MNAGGSTSHGRKTPSAPRSRKGLADPAWRGPALCISLAQCWLKQDLGSPGKVTLLTHQSPAAPLPQRSPAQECNWFPGNLGGIQPQLQALPLPSHRLLLRAPGGGGCQPIIKSNRGQRRVTSGSCDTAQPPGPPNSCTPAMAPSPLAWLLSLAAFFHLFTQLAGE